MSLMVSISGIRGIVGESLTPHVIVKYSSAFARYCNGGTIIVGRDGRVTGKIITELVLSTLQMAGCNVIDLGIVPTPTVALGVEKLQAAGGIAITASHNPMQWNGLKFMGPTGMFLNGDENKKFWTIADEGRFPVASWDKLGVLHLDHSFVEKHIDEVLHLPYIHVDQIIKRKFKVVVDCIDAAGGIIVPHMLSRLGCTVIKLNCDVKGIFSHTPEPIPENLSDLAKSVLREKADFGIAVDPDVDRLVFITEKGEPFGEEYTVTSAIKFILDKTQQKSPVSVAVNLSTTRAVDDVAHAYGAKVYRTAVGEINVAQKMKEIGSIIGGEGNGGVILPALHYGRDSIVGIGIILQQLAEFGGTLSEFKQTLPQYEIIKTRVDVTGKNPDQLLDHVKALHMAGGKINSDDGLKIDFPKAWVHLRKSNTEPIIRIIAEAPTRAEAEKLVYQFHQYLI
jgi:phosphomannomutase